MTRLYMISEGRKRACCAFDLVKCLRRHKFTIMVVPSPQVIKLLSFKFPMQGSAAKHEFPFWTNLTFGPVRNLFSWFAAQDAAAAEPYGAIASQTSS